MKLLGTQQASAHLNDEELVPKQGGSFVVWMWVGIGFGMWILNNFAVLITVTVNERFTYGMGLPCNSTFLPAGGVNALLKHQNISLLQAKHTNT